MYTNIFSENAKLDPCHRFMSKMEGGEYEDWSKMEGQSNECIPDNFYINETVACDNFIYSTDIFSNTLTSEIDLVNQHIS
jgi:hypothetical protein